MATALTLPATSAFAAAESSGGDELRLLLNLGAAVGLALVGGAIATRLRQPAVVGYLAAGVVIGPFTPGFVGNAAQITELADLGVILLLFTIGVEFSLGDLVRMHRRALGAGVAHVAIVVAAVTAAMAVAGFAAPEALVIGAGVAISSTLVVFKNLGERGELDSLHGRVSISWMILQDLLVVVFVVLLPSLAGGDPTVPLLLALGKAVVFLLLAYVVGTRLLPFVFAVVARLGSSELFLLAVVSTALITAYVSSAVFGLGPALGAFVAGVVISESDLAHQAVAEVVPFRDLFAVLFFVSVGMLVDPAALAHEWQLVLVLAVLAIAGKALVAATLGWLARLPVRSAILLGATVTPVGEFSFILARDAGQLGIVQPAAFNALLGTAVVTILGAPLVLAGATAAARRVEARRDAREAGFAAAGAVIDPIPGGAAGETPADGPATAPTARPGALERPHVVVIGAGRVGMTVIRALRARGLACAAIDRDRRALDEAERLGAVPVYGDGANSTVLAAAGLATARVLIVSIDDRMLTQLAVERARRLNPRLTMAARARRSSDLTALWRAGVQRIADPELEAGIELARHALQRMGVSGPELSAIAGGLRSAGYGPGLVDAGER